MWITSHLNVVFNKVQLFGDKVPFHIQRCLNWWLATTLTEVDRNISENRTSLTHNVILLFANSSNI